MPILFIFRLFLAISLTFVRKKYEQTIYFPCFDISLKNSSFFAYPTHYVIPTEP